MDFEFIKSAFVTMFVVIDPPGLAPIFVTITAAMTAAERMATARQAIFIAFCILLAAVATGEALLNLLGVGMPAFRIAGGLFLFSIAVEMVFEKREERKAQTAEKVITQDHLNSVAAFPLAIPLMAGPGTISATIIQASNAGDNILNIAALIVILAIILGMCLAAFLCADRIDRALGVTGRIVLMRLLGVLLAAMAVQIIGDGIVAFSAS